jgi:hypothetical protein
MKGLDSLVRLFHWHIIKNFEVKNQVAVPPLVREMFSSFLSSSPSVKGGWGPYQFLAWASKANVNLWRCHLAFKAVLG